MGFGKMILETNQKENFKTGEGNLLPHCGECSKKDQRAC